MPATSSNSIIRQLQIVFSVSVVLLVLSLFASFYSTQKLILNSQLVNHTNQVLIEAENIISYMKDAETGQRGFLVTLDPQFLQPYNGSYEKTSASYNTLILLTSDNPVQQKNLEEAKKLYEAKFIQMQKIIDKTRKNEQSAFDTDARQKEMLKGKQVMDQLRLVIERIKTEENKMLKERTEAQQVYITYTPILLVFAALISILITGFAYFRIKKDLDDRLRKQKEAEAKYIETAQRITIIEGMTKLVSEGDYSVRSSDNIDDELGRISTALNKMTGSLEQTFNDLSNKNWLQTGTVKLSDAIRGERILKNLAENLISTITGYINAPLGTIYILDKDWNYKLFGNVAASLAPKTIKAGEGLTHQAIRNKESLIIRDLPENYITVNSSLGNTPPTCLVILPLVYGNDCIGIIEIGLLREPGSLEMQFLKDNLEMLSIGVNAALDYVKLQEFLEETQAQSEELQTQHSELENLNAELEAQSQKLQASEEELRVQQEELQQTNGELEERSSLLEEKNLEIEKKAEELELTTRYKSEFLANMSHELRTPLNSILLLSRLLAENDEKNLSSDQVEYATVIQSSGNGLLGLIDEILDLSKIEAGKMDLDYARISVREITEDIKALFN
ncbi:MAG: CHASE3 domain-containing protein, partial [Dyadobacter sp.]